MPGAARVPTFMTVAAALPSSSGAWSGQISHQASGKCVDVAGTGNWHPWLVLQDCRDSTSTQKFHWYSDYNTCLESESGGSLTMLNEWADVESDFNRASLGDCGQLESYWTYNAVEGTLKMSGHSNDYWGSYPAGPYCLEAEGSSNGSPVRVTTCNLGASQQWNLDLPPSKLCHAIAYWPQFASMAELQADPWGNYFEMVYGEIPSFTFPFCVGDIWLFYDDLITKSGAQAKGVQDGFCPYMQNGYGMEGGRYRTNNMYQPAGVSYSFHAPPYKTFPSNTWIEVSHKADPFGDEHYGMWLLLATGNGIWFNTGVTRSFSEHRDAFSFFAVSGGNVNERMCKAAAARNYDSIQFDNHVDHVNYPCDGKAQFPYLNIEIVAVKLTGTYACGAVGGAPSTIRAGWKGSRACHCNEALGTLNCGVLASNHTDVV